MNLRIGVLKEDIWKICIKKSNECLEVATNCSQLKMPAPDGKLRLTYVTTIEQLLCIGYRELGIRKILGLHH